MATETRLTGVLYTYRTHILYVGALIASARHQHHAGQVLWAPGGVELESADGAPRRVITHVVPPGTLHGHGAAAAAAVLWVDQDEVSWQRAARDVHDVPEGLRCSVGERLGEGLSRDEAERVARALLEQVVPAGSPHTAPLHPAVARMCALLDDGASGSEASVARLARRAGLSPRQLRQRFGEALGLSPRAYLRWRRLRRAITAIEGGATLTEAAIRGGFADSAHFSRVFHAQFGMAPRRALASMRFGGALAPGPSAP